MGILGRRVHYDREKGGLLQPGDYCKIARGHWWLCSPNGHFGTIGDKNVSGNEEHHSVTEHEDGTITVSPSIKISDNEGECFHGYLERGVWRTC